MKYKGFSSSACGYKHAVNNKPSEDASLLVSDEGRVIFAVADGHGDENCVRSGTGADLACRIAVAELGYHADVIRDRALEDRLMWADAGAMFMKHLTRKVAHHWNKAVKEHLANNPFTEDELQTCPDNAEEYRKGNACERAYGTTLIAGLVTDRYMILLQQGDGHCVAFDRSGNAFQPIPWDERCVSSATTSMCYKNADKAMRYCIRDLRDGKIAAVFAGTDGVEDSFPTSINKTYAYYRSALELAGNEGVDAMVQFLEKDLPVLSERGSQDDISVAGVVCTDDLALRMEDFARQDEIDSVESEIQTLNAKISSMETGGKFQHCKEEREKAVLQYEMLQKKHQNLSAVCTDLAHRIDIHEQEFRPDMINLNFMLEFFDFMKTYYFTGKFPSMLKSHYQAKCKERDDTAQDMEAAKAKMESAEQELQPIQDRYDGYLARKTEAEERLRVLKKECGQPSLEDMYLVNKPEWSVMA